LTQALHSDSIDKITRPLHVSLQTTADLIESRLPYLQPAQGQIILRRMIALLIGLPGSVTLTPAENSPADVFAELAAVLNLQLYALETLHRRKSATPTTAN
jgi:hypothetical protein